MISNFKLISRVGDKKLNTRYVAQVTVKSGIFNKTEVVDITRKASTPLWTFCSGWRTGNTVPAKVAQLEEAYLGSLGVYSLRDVQCEK